MRFVLTRDAEEFTRRAESLIMGRPELNVLATVLMNVRAGHFRDTGPVFAYGLEAHDQVSFAALHTPPWPLLVTELAPDDAPGFLDAWLATDPAVAGVNGPAATARAVAAAWRERTGGQTRLRMAQALHAVTQVSDPLRPAAGRLRPAPAGERELIVDWMRAFTREAGVEGVDRAEQTAAAYLSREGVFVWDDDGPVSMVVTNPMVAGTIRISFVYTPPEHRRRGYAATAVAAISRRVLAAGATRCTLFTDLANPTSNKIYAEVGYRPVGVWEQHEFEPQST